MISISVRICMKFYHKHLFFLLAASICIPFAYKNSAKTKLSVTFFERLSIWVSFNGELTLDLKLVCFDLT